MPKGTRNQTRPTLLVLLLILGLLLMGCSMSSSPPPAATAPAPTNQNSSSPAPAKAGGSQLEEILKKGEIVIGMGTTFPPWGYYDKNQQLVGYDVDVAQELAKDLGVKLVLVDTTNNNRIPYLLTGKVDIVVAVFGATPERAKSVAFSEPYAPFFVVMATKQGSNVKTLADVKAQAKNLRIATTKGTTSDQLLTAALSGVEFTRYENPTDLFLAMKQGKVDVGVEGYDGMAVFAKQSPGWEVQTSPPLKQTFPTIGLRRGEQDLLNWVNIWIREFSMSGRNGAIYEKHFGAPLPNFQPRY